MRLTAKAFVSVVTLAAVAVSGLSCADISFADTIDGKRISSDTEIGGEIIIKGDLTVEKGASLTIKSGSNLTFDGGVIEVYGSLRAEGTEEAPIRFSMAQGRSDPGNCIRITNSKEGKSVISHCDFSGLDTAVTVTNSAAVIENSSFINNQIAIDVKQKDKTIIRKNAIKNGLKVGIFCKNDSGAVITDNLIAGVRKFGIYIYRSDGVKVSGNEILNCGGGIMVNYVGTDPQITGNRISSNKTGIAVEKGANPAIAQNTISGNDVGIGISKRSDPMIEGNDITGNVKGVFITFSSYPVMKKNNLFNNEYAVYLKFQSAQWEKELGDSTNRGGEKAQPARSMGAFGGDTSSEHIAPKKNPSEKVSASGNFWGDEVTKEMEEGGPASNISAIYDYYDAKEFMFEGKKYKLDSVDYSSWSKEMIKTK